MRVGHAEPVEVLGWHKEKIQMKFKQASMFLATTVFLSKKSSLLRA